MRRPDLTVSIKAEQKQWNKHYHLTQSPSIHDKNDFESATARSIHKLDIPTPALPEYCPPKPSIRLLYSFCTKRDILILLLPAVASSCLAGAMAPFMTLVIGQAFDAFAQFPLTPNPPQQAKRDLLHNVGLVSVELIALAAGQLAFSSLMSSLWIWMGERNVMRLRKRVYDAITAKSMTWYDLKLGGDSKCTTDVKFGAGGLMAKFTRETDDVRMASALTAGMIIQHLVTLVTCLILAFVHSWSLTLVILSTVPLVIVVQSISQGYGLPLYDRERASTAKAGTLLERAISNIATVKAFNASSREAHNFNRVVDSIQRDANKSSAVWAISLGFSQFQSMTLFIQAFGFGAKLVRSGKISPGDVMAVFWACLIGATSLQSAIPFFQAFAKGQVSMAALVTFIEQPTPSPASHSPSVLRRKSSTLSLGASTAPVPLRGIRPAKCSGEFTLRNITFAYPSRPDLLVLQDVSMYLPAHEMTFIVGGSGSGKSTLAQLLLRMYQPQYGSIELDNQIFSYIDTQWAQQHICGVNQGCMLFDMSLHDNVAMGLASIGDGAGAHERASRSQVVAACRVALMHEFIRDLPQGYDTPLGTGGANLSGGQKQRLAIARAWMRDPTVLILDEATSALDPTSRLLVFEAIKSWRKNKTTIVITHDLSQIESSDFVYLLKNGRIIEQGYRGDLEMIQGGEFRAMADTQGEHGFPQKTDSQIDQEDTVDALLEELEEDLEEITKAGWSSRHQSLGVALRPLTSTWMFDVLADMTRGTIGNHGSKLSVNVVPPQDHQPPEWIPLSRRPSSFAASPICIPPVALTHTNRRSLPFSSPFSSSAFSYKYIPSEPDLALTNVTEMTNVEDDQDFETQKTAINSSGMEASKRRVQSSRRQPYQLKRASFLAVQDASIEVDSDEKPLSVLRVLRNIYPSVPSKPWVAIGIVTCLISGSMTPIFSFMLSRLFFEVSAGARNVEIITKFALITFAVAAADGFFAGLKSMLMENVAVRWMTKTRKAAFVRVLAQDKAWFDNPVNNPARLVDVLIKDADDAKRLLSICLGMFFVVSTMLIVGLVWAMVLGWQLTLVGIALVPIFAGAMTLQTGLTSKFQLRNKRAREEVSKIYYDAISNMRDIRAMGFQSVFASQYDAALLKALRTGVSGSFTEGSGFGVTNAMIYLSEALLFYVGAVLVARGSYTYLQMVQVLNLLVFSVSIAAQMMVFVDKIAKSAQAARDMHKVLCLPTNTKESQGFLYPTMRGRVTFRNVSFAYPQRPGVLVLKNVSLEFKDGQSVAIVGSSGSGKSTIAALLQRLYEPSKGQILVGKTDIGATDVTWLREHVSVVSQKPHLFDTTIHENIAYGASEFPFAQVRRAAKAANAHDFVMSLPKDYNTCVGENASLISGGQVQRLQIARALVRPCNILVLDECTSSLDADNQAKVMETIQRVKVGRTTILITHNLSVMRMCDHIVVMHEGSVVEQGTYDTLIEQRGPFFNLTKAGEWTTDA